MDGFLSLTPESLKTPDGINQLNRMLKFLFDLAAGDGNSVRVYSGFGIPTIAAGNGSLFLRYDGSGGNTLYCMEAGSWTAK